MNDVLINQFAWLIFRELKKHSPVRKKEHHRNEQGRQWNASIAQLAGRNRRYRVLTLPV
jgi:hypothetical protein